MEQTHLCVACCTKTPVTLLSVREKHWKIRHCSSNFKRKTNVCCYSKLISLRLVIYYSTTTDYFSVTACPIIFEKLKKPPDPF